MKYRIVIVYPHGDDVIVDAISVSYSDSGILCYKTADGLVHETNAIWHYSQVKDQ